MQPITDPTAAQQLSPAALLESAIREPGRIHEGYFAFWEYSLGNQLLAVGQCTSRGITPGPLATFRRWIERGRHVRKGEKAIVLCQPVTLKRMVEKTGQPEEVAFTKFIHKASWFVLGQTEGEPFSPAPLPRWDRTRALQVLAITETPFDLMNGNVWGYCAGATSLFRPCRRCRTGLCFMRSPTSSLATPPRVRRWTAPPRLDPCGRLKPKASPCSVQRPLASVVRSTRGATCSIGCATVRSRSDPHSEF